MVARDLARDGTAEDDLVASLLLTLPIGLAFGFTHLALLRRIDTSLSVASLAAIVRARLVGSSYLTVLGLGVVLETLTAQPLHPYWNAPVVALLLVVAGADVASLARGEWTARRLLASVFSGSSPLMHVDDATAIVLPTALAPIGPIEGEAVLLLRGAVGATFRESAGRKVAALLPAEVAARFRE